MTNGKNKNALILSAVLLVIMLVITFYLAWYAKNEVFESINTDFRDEAKEIINTIRDNFDLQINSLYAVRAHVAGIPNLNNYAWYSYIETFVPGHVCPCANFTVWIERVFKENRLSFEKSAKTDKSWGNLVFKDFKIFPETDKAEYFIVRYSYPIEGSEKAFGFDTSSEDVRRTAMEKARDSGEAAMTGLITTVPGPKGFIIVLPVYKTAEIPKTVEERREMLRGFVYSVFYATDFLTEILKKYPAIFGNTDFEIYDKLNGKISTDNLVFDSYPGELKAASPLQRPNLKIAKTFYPFSQYWENLFYSQNLIIADKTWMMFFYAPTSARTQDVLDKQIGWIALISGMIISFLSSWTLWSLLTSRKRALEEAKILTAELRKSEQQYREMVENSPFAIAVHSEDKIVMANKVAAELLGARTIEEIVGKPISEIVHPDYHKIVRERIRKEFEEKLPAPPLEEKFIKLDGTVIDVLVTGSPMIFGGKPAAQVVIQDITRRKKAEKELKERTEQLEKFNKVLAGRELRMAELKKEIEELKKKIP